MNKGVKCLSKAWSLGTTGSWNLKVTTGSDSELDSLPWLLRTQDSRQDSRKVVVRPWDLQGPKSLHLQGL